jgi:alanine dehydrogenase
VTVVDKSTSRLRELSHLYGSEITTVYATNQAIESLACDSDLVVGAVLVAGAEAPRLLTRETISNMRPGSVVVDISIDQGGCFETSRPTTHAEPTYIVDDVVHYCVTNMPGAVPRTSAFALNNVTLRFVRALADKGLERACADDPHLENGINVQAGKICHPAVAAALENHRAA